MAESQVPYPYTAADFQAVGASLSQPRFATYMTKGGNNAEYAFALYLYNARVAKACLFPLNVTEVTLRNAIDERLIALYGPNWHLEAGFRNSVLLPDGLKTLDKAISRAGGASALHEQVVATLTFDFWSNFFRPDYGQSFWRTSLTVVFPHLPHGVTRHQLHQAVKAINTFRNRVAHHEPVLDLNVTDIFARMAELIGYRCPLTEKWLRYHSTLNAMIRTRPRSAAGVQIPLSARMDANWVRVTLTMTVQDTLAALTPAHPAIIAVDAAGRPIAAMTPTHLAAFIAAEAAGLGGMISLSELSIDEVLKAIPVTGQWTPLLETVPLATAIAELQKPRIQLIVGTNAAGTVTGALVRAHRRY